ncbi:MAG: hypothetical protein LAP38_19940 [Acidobacteriia bacterium]|nr:hypothetical protein [Terriglobia bacterium]
MLAGLSLAPMHAEDSVRYQMPAETFTKVSAREQAAITAAICDGTAEGTRCDTCPESTPEASGGFTLKDLFVGHFLTPHSTDALVTVSGCEERHASIGWGFLVTRRAGVWEAHGDMLGLELGHCHAMQFRSGRQFLVCEGYGMESFQLMHGVNVVFGKGGSIGFRNLLTATDTTRLCDAQSRVQAAQIDKIEFGDLNGDGVEDVSFTASFGAMRDSKRRRDLCQEAQDRKPGTPGPGPSVMKTYRIKYLFDGERFTLTKESEAAAKLFRWEN